MSKSYQDWCVDTLTDILCNLNQYSGGVKGDSYKYVISALVDHYASLYCVTDGACQGCQINLWGDWLAKCDRKVFFSSVLMTREARLNIMNAGSEEEIKDKVHFEHIVPRSYVVTQLLKTIGKNRIATIKEIQRILRHSKIVVVASEGQKNLLDGKGERITEEDVEFLKNYCSNCDKEIEEALGCRGKCSKSNGSALVRLAHLARKIRPNPNQDQSVFCMFDGKDVKPEDWISHLESPNVISYKMEQKPEKCQRRQSKCKLCK